MLEVLLCNNNGFPLCISWKGCNTELSCFYLICSVALTKRAAGYTGDTLNMNLMAFSSLHPHLPTNFVRLVSASVLLIVLAPVFAQ